MPPHRPHRNTGISAHFEFARKQLLEALLSPDDHDQVDSFDTELGSPTAAPDLYEGGRAPAIRHPAGGDTLAFFRPEDKSPFHQMGDNGDALCAPQNVVGNALIRRVDEFVQHFG